jgi:8-oxo-dGTP pyrophosphatase MutT (NUDIX family)
MPASSITQFKTLTRNLDMEHGLSGFSENHRLAAVLILVYPGEDGLNIILTRRTEHLPHHAGQISFPGGSVEPGDASPVHTALREAREEVALDDNLVEVLGVLDITLLPSGFAVAPVLAVTETLPALSPCPEEVAEIFSIPLSVIADLELYQEDYVERDGERRDFYYLNYQDYYIWGATARMLLTLGRFLKSALESQ